MILETVENNSSDSDTKAAQPRLTYLIIQVQHDDEYNHIHQFWRWMRKHWMEQ